LARRYADLTPEHLADAAAAFDAFCERSVDKADAMKGRVAAAKQQGEESGALAMLPKLRANALRSTEDGKPTSEPEARALALLEGLRL
jgi:hypothetical protein